MKVKIFKFWLNHVEFLIEDDKRCAHYENTEVNPMEEMELAINSFCDGKNVISIDVRSIDTRLPLAREFWYTIVYSEA